MPPSESNGDVVLRLLDGRSAQREMVLEGGRAMAPFAVGSQGAWSVSAAHVGKAHVMFAFNGTCLFVCALRGEMAVLDGAPLETRWTEAAMPSEVRFGSARISIGRRAGPDELTQVPDQDVTRIAEVVEQDVTRIGQAPPLVTPARPARPAPREEEVTCFDEERLQDALRLSAYDDEVTCIADVEIPAAARGTSDEEITTPPSPPLPVPRPITRSVRIARAAPESARTLAAPQERAPLSPTAAMTAQLLAGLGSDGFVPSALITKREEAGPAAPAADETLPRDEEEPPSAVMSSMPPTIPSDGLMAAASQSFSSPFPVDVARPSSPTMAIPQPARRSVPEGERHTPLPCSLDSVHAAVLAVSGEGPEVTSITARRSGTRWKVGQGWKELSLPKKAIALLLLPALIGVIFMRRPQEMATAESEPSHAVTAPAPVVAKAPAVEPAPTPIASAARVEPQPAVPPASAAASARPKASPAGLYDTRTAERRALDTAASGLDTSAAEQYEALAVAHPDSVAFREAARILRERAAHHD